MQEDRKRADLFELFELNCRFFEYPYIGLDVFTGQAFRWCYGRDTVEAEEIDYDTLKAKAREKAREDPDFDPSVYDGLTRQNWKDFLPISGDFLMAGDTLIRYLGERFTIRGEFDEFANQKEKKRVVLPEGIRSIGERAFFNSKLHEVILPSSLSSIGDRAFLESGLETFVVPEGMALTICTTAFDYCMNLQLLQIDSQEVTFVLPEERKREEYDRWKVCLGDVPFGWIRRPTEIRLSEAFRGKAGWLLFRKTEAVETLCERYHIESVPHKTGHPDSVEMEFRLTRFMGDYYMHIRSAYWCWEEEVFALPKELPPEWDANLLADWIAESCEFGDVYYGLHGEFLEPIRKDPDFAKACAMMAIAAFRESGVPPFPVYWQEKVYRIPLTVAPGAQKAFDAWKPSVLSECIQDFADDVAYWTARINQETICAYIDALGSTAEGQEIVRRLGIPDGEDPVETVVKVMFPVSAHYYMDSEGLIVFSMDFALDENWQGFLRYREFCCDDYFDTYTCCDFTRRKNEE